MTDCCAAFHVGHEDRWPDWFADAVTDNRIVTKSGGWGNPIEAADVLIRGQYIRAHKGDYVVLDAEGMLSIRYGKHND